MAFLVSYDPDDGRVLVGSSDEEADGLATSVVRGSDGIWRADVPSADDLKDNFEPVRNPKKVAAYIKEAKKAAAASAADRFDSPGCPERLLSRCDGKQRAIRQGVERRYSRSL
jgi:hypothetical protein